MSLWRWSMVVAFIVGWTALTSAGLVNAILIPSPKSVLSVALSLSQWKTTSGDLGATCLRLLLGFLLGSIVGIVVGIAMGRSARIYHVMEFPIDFLRSIPVAALFPLFVVFLGIGNSSKVGTTAWSTSLIVVVNTMYGVRSSSPVRELFARTLGASRAQILRSIVIPEALPSIFAGLRTGLSIALIVVIMTEMFLGTPSGLGQRIFNSALLYETPQLYFYVGLTGLLGYLVNRGSVSLEKRLLAWQHTGSDQR